jgi:hypothetical protein
MKTRLALALNHGHLSVTDVDALISSSPLTQDLQQCAIRTGKLYFVSSRIRIDDSSVEPLIDHWGGEVVYFWLKDVALKMKLKEIGTPSVIEVAIPIKENGMEYRVAEALFDTLNGDSSASGIDCFVKHDVPPDSIVAVHQPGSSGFERFSPVQL